MPEAIILLTFNMLKLFNLKGAHSEDQISGMSNASLANRCVITVGEIAEFLYPLKCPIAIEKRMHAGKRYEGVDF